MINIEVRVCFRLNNVFSFQGGSMSGTQTPATKSVCWMAITQRLCNVSSSIQNTWCWHRLAQTWHSGCRRSMSQRKNQISKVCSRGIIQDPCHQGGKRSSWKPPSSSSMHLKYLKSQESPGRIKCLPGWTHEGNAEKCFSASHWVLRRELARCGDRRSRSTL